MTNTDTTIPQIAGVALAQADLARMPRVARYHVLVASGRTKKDAAVLAGYSPGTHPEVIEQSQISRRTARTIEQTREEYRQRRGYRYEDVLSGYRAIAQGTVDDPAHVDESGKPKRLYVAAPARVAALQAMSIQQGYNAPQRMEVRGVQLIADLGALSRQEIAALHAHFTHETTVCQS